MNLGQEEVAEVEHKKSATPLSYAGISQIRFKGSKLGFSQSKDSPSGYDTSETYSYNSCNYMLFKQS